MKHPVLIGLALVVVLGAAVGCYFLAGNSELPAFTSVKAAYRELRVVVSTNGIIEPVDRSEVYAPIEGFVTSITKKEGAEIRQSQLLLKLNSEQIRSALAESTAALLSARRQARVVETGPSKEEIAELDASIAETAMQLDQQNKDLATEKALLAKQATPRAAVDAIQKQLDLLQVRADSLKKKKEDLLARYSSEDRQWEQGRITELTRQVDSLQRQLLSESVPAPKTGLIYSLQVKQGSYVSKGQLLAQIYQPGKIQLRSYVDEPDLGRVRKGQAVRIEWDGLPNEHWTGVVEKPAEQVIAMNNRSVGEILCSIEAGPPGLIPNLNVRVEITTDLKPNALVVPRSAVFNPGGHPSVLLIQGEKTVTKRVGLGLFTSEEIEIVSGIKAGDAIVLNPAEVANK